MSANRPARLILAAGTLSGAATALSLLAQRDSTEPVTVVMTALCALVGAQAGALAAALCRSALRAFVRNRRYGRIAELTYREHDAAPYALWLITVLGAFGLQLIAPVFVAIAAAFALWQWRIAGRALAAAAIEMGEPAPVSDSRMEVLSPLFFLSGTAALIYQVAWQRTLYNLFGVNMESVTIIVSVFMFGLGIGALCGGRLSRLGGRTLPMLFVAIELGIGVFGVFSLPLISRVGAAAQLQSLPMMTATVFGLLAIPTLLMGATLPVLVAYVHRESGDVRASVARLYFVNTLGSALACFLTVDVLFALFGLRSSTLTAAACNVAVAGLCLVYALSQPDESAHVPGAGAPA